MRSTRNSIVFDNEQERIALSAIAYARLLVLERKKELKVGEDQEILYLQKLIENLKQVGPLGN